MSKLVLGIEECCAWSLKLGIWANGVGRVDAGKSNSTAILGGLGLWVVVVAYSRIMAQCNVPFKPSMSHYSPMHPVIHFRQRRKGGAINAWSLCDIG